MNLSNNEGENSTVKKIVEFLKNNYIIVILVVIVIFTCLYIYTTNNNKKAKNTKNIKEGEVQPSSSQGKNNVISFLDSIYNF